MAGAKAVAGSLPGAWGKWALDSPVEECLPLWHLFLGDLRRMSWPCTHCLWALTSGGVAWGHHPP